MPQPTTDDYLLSDDQALKIVRAAVEAAGPAGQTEDDVRRVLDWAIRAALDQAALGLIFSGEMGAFIQDGEMVWKLLQP